MKEITDREVPGTFETTETEERVPETLRSNQTNEVVRRACSGDYLAVVDIDEVVGPRLVKQARDVPGPSYDYEAKDVLLRLYRRMLEKKCPPGPAAGGRDSLAVQGGRRARAGAAAGEGAETLGSGGRLRGSGEVGAGSPRWGTRGGVWTGARRARGGGRARASGCMPLSTRRLPPFHKSTVGLLAVRPRNWKLRAPTFERLPTSPDGKRRPHAASSAAG
jgi:hypothetical protein